MIRASHRWQSCAVRLMAHRGVRQFLDLGCGYLTTGTADDELMPVHEAAWGAGITAAHVLYADQDGEAADAAWLMTGQAPGTGAVCADMRDVGAVLGSDAGRRLIDPCKPCGIIFRLELALPAPGGGAGDGGRVGGGGRTGIPHRGHGRAVRGPGTVGTGQGGAPGAVVELQRGGDCGAVQPGWSCCRRGSGLSSGARRAGFRGGRSWPGGSGCGADRLQ